MITASEKQFTFTDAIDYTFFEILQGESIGKMKKNEKFFIFFKIFFRFAQMTVNRAVIFGL